MVNKILINLCILTILSSCIPTERTVSGHKIPTKKFDFKNKNKFTIGIYDVINPNHLYRLTDMYFTDNNFVKMRGGIFDGLVQILQFYPNGAARMFPQNYMNPDPNIIGDRGVIYKKNNWLKIDLTSSDQDGSLFIQSYKIKVEKDKLYLLEEGNTFLFNPSEYICYVFEKSEKVPDDWKKFSADW